MVAGRLSVRGVAVGLVAVVGVFLKVFFPVTWPALSVVLTSKRARPSRARTGSCFWHRNEISAHLFATSWDLALTVSVTGTWDLPTWLLHFPGTRVVFAIFAKYRKQTTDIDETCPVNGNGRIPNA